MAPSTFKWLFFKIWFLLRFVNHTPFSSKCCIKKVQLIQGKFWYNVYAGLYKPTCENHWWASKCPSDLPFWASDYFPLKLVFFITKLRYYCSSAITRNIGLIYCSTQTEIVIYKMHARGSLVNLWASQFFFIWASVFRICLPNWTSYSMLYTN